MRLRTKLNRFEKFDWRVICGKSPFISLVSFSRKMCLYFHFRFVAVNWPEMESSRTFSRIHFKVLGREAFKFSKMPCSRPFTALFWSWPWSRSL